MSNLLQSEAQTTHSFENQALDALPKLNPLPALVKEYVETHQHCCLKLTFEKPKCHGNIQDAAFVKCRKESQFN